MTRVRIWLFVAGTILSAPALAEQTNVRAVDAVAKVEPLAKQAVAPNVVHEAHAAEGEAKTERALAATPATASDVLGLTRIVLDTSRAHSQQSQDYMRNIFYALGFIAAGLGFFGFREIKSVLKPYKDKLEVMGKEYDEKLAAMTMSQDAAVKKHSEDVAALTQEHGHMMAEQIESLERMKTDHERAMAEQIAGFVRQSQLNAKALVVASTIWQYIGTDNPLEEELREAVRLVDVAMPADQVDQLDTFLTGVLLIRKAYAQKRLGDVDGAFASAQRAVELNGDDSKHFWLYNTACYASLCNRADECVAYLQRALASDPAAKNKARQESDFDSVRQDPRFEALVA